MQKATYCTRAVDQTFGVYDSDAASTPESPAARLMQLRDRLDGKMPPALRADWTAFLEALNAESGERAAAVAKAPAGLQAAEAALALPASTAPAD